MNCSYYVISLFNYKSMFNKVILCLQYYLGQTMLKIQESFDNQHMQWVHFAGVWHTVECEGSGLCV